jgi:hypothetical protein
MSTLWSTIAATTDLRHRSVGYKQFKRYMDSRKIWFKPRFPEELMGLWGKHTAYRGRATTGYRSTVGKSFDKSTHTTITIFPQR